MADAFSSAVPPATVTLPASLITSSGDVLLAETTGQLTGINRTSATYNLFGEEYATTTDTGSAGGTNDSLVDYFTWAVDPTRLNLTLDSSLATDYAMDFTLTNERPIIDILDELADFHCHGFYIEDGTLYLIDMEQNNGTKILEGRYDFFTDEVGYQAPKPYSIFKGGEFSVTGAYPNGDEFTQSKVYSTAQAEVEAQLTRKKTLLDKWWITFNLPIGDNTIDYGQKITFSDISKFIELDVVMWARDFYYTLDSGMEKLTIAGEGTIAAA